MTDLVFCLFFKGHMKGAALCLQGKQVIDGCWVTAEHLEV